MFSLILLVFFWVIKTRLRGVAAFLRRVLQHRVSLVFFNLVVVKPIQFKPIQFQDNIRHDLVVTFFIWGRECRCLQVRCLQSFTAPYPSWPRVKPGTASPFGVSSVFSLQSWLPVGCCQLSLWIWQFSSPKGIQQSLKAGEDLIINDRNSDIVIDTGDLNFCAPTSKPTSRPWCMRKYRFLTLN